MKESTDKDENGELDLSPGSEIPTEKAELKPVNFLPEAKVEPESDKSSSCTNATDDGDETVKQDPEDLYPRKFVLRPRKTDPCPEEEEEEKEAVTTKRPKLKNGIPKTEEKKGTVKTEEEPRTPTSCHEPGEGDNPPGNPTTEEDSFQEIDIDEIKLEVFSNSGPSSENDGGSSEPMSIARSDDSKQCKESSESETRVSSASDNGKTKSSSERKKKRRRYDMKWSRKRKRGEHKEEFSLSPAMAFEWRDTENSSPRVNGHQQKKSREFAIPSPSLADISMKPAIPESTATSLEAAKPTLCHCRKNPQVFISGNNNAGDLYCQALDCIDNRIVGCCNAIPSQDVGLFRVSDKTPYQMMCVVHQQRLCRHLCCPVCGLFCTQGRYQTCKSLHYFHKTCVMTKKSKTVACPHCGDETLPKDAIVSFHSLKDPVFLPQQKPVRNANPAKITVVRGQRPEVRDEEPVFRFPTTVPGLDAADLTPSNGISSLQRDKYSYKSLYAAAQNGDAEKLLNAIASGADPNHLFEENGGQTALHVAAANGHLSVVHILLQAKAQINVLDGELNTPFTLAITSNRNDVVKYLVKCGADLVLKSEDGMTPLHIAAKCGNLDACYHILNGTHLPRKYIDGLDDGGWTPMVWAAEFNHLEVVKFLLSKGADPVIKDAEQNIALHWAAFGGSIDIVELFLNDGSDINAVNVHGDTPLHIASRQGKYNCVLLLMARGAKSQVQNKSGELPRDCTDSPASDIYKVLTLNMELGLLLTRFQGRSPRVVANDITRGKERNQIRCVNAVDEAGEPRDYVYVSESCFTSKISVDRTITSLQFCKCSGHCGSEECNCAVISIKCWYDIDGRLLPDFNYADPPMIFECNQACQCNRITCRNRVVQNGISCRFELFRTESKGWGIKTLNLIPKGTYVCEYVGEIISDCEADHREDDSYLFDLDNRDGETYCIDARHYGNFARFINHMCVPNLMPVHVFVDHQDLKFPRIAFFANRDILPNEELGYNYGEKFWVIKWKSFTCTCGAEKCIYSEHTIKTTLDNYRKRIEETS